jgi:hypothetical protein
MSKNYFNPDEYYRKYNNLHNVIQGIVQEQQGGVDLDSYFQTSIHKKNEKRALKLLDEEIQNLSRIPIIKHVEKSMTNEKSGHLHRFSLNLHEQLHFDPVQLSSVDDLVACFRKPSLYGIKVALPDQNSEQIITLFPTLSLVLEHNAVKTAESLSETLVKAKFTECQHIHSRKPLFLSLKEAFS